MISGDPEWLIAAKRYIGVREIKGAPTQHVIAEWLSKLGAWWSNDEVPWCGVAQAAWMQMCDVPIPKHWYRARDWLNWGTPLPNPVVGAVAILDGGKYRPGGGHVGTVVGGDMHNRILLIGGNQSDSVRISPFDRSRVLGYRYPAKHLGNLLPDNLPVYASAEAASSLEA